MIFAVKFFKIGTTFLGYLKFRKLMLEPVKVAPTKEPN